MKAKKADKSQRYAELLDHAVKLFEKKGYSSTTMRDIAKAMNLTQGSLYYYIKKKEDLLIKIHNIIIDIILDNANSITDDMATIEKLNIIMTAIIETVAQKRSYVSVFLKEYKHIQPEVYQNVIAKRKKFEKFITGIIETEIRRGDFIDVDPQLAFMALMGMFNWSLQWVDIKGRCSLVEIKNSFLRIFFYGMQKRNLDQKE
ncbi:MAG: TetR/AcrR family transcriptional regulator [Desulfobacterales bacterium]|jgi:AcrR family transcriptional regulator|nr:TetR/AcrR family transcriptional regulator [Desulfobacterales bacterium]